MLTKLHKQRCMPAFPLAICKVSSRGRNTSYSLSLLWQAAKAPVSSLLLVLCGSTHTHMHLSPTTPSGSPPRHARPHYPNLINILQTCLLASDLQMFVNACFPICQGLVVLACRFLESVKKELKEYANKITYDPPPQERPGAPNTTLQTD